jgi:hypothetical protein
MKILTAIPSIQLSADTSDNAALDIQLLGVPADWADRQPTATRFPQSFSNESSIIWQKMFSDAEFTTSIRKELTIPLQWKFAFKLFMRLCEEKGVQPFTSERNRVDNSSLIGFIKTSRIRLADFFNSTRLFEVLRIVRGSQKRKYDVGYSKFGLQSSIRVKCPFRTISDLEKYLYAHKFVKEPNSSYKKIITPNCIVHVNATFINRVEVSFVITGNQSVFMGTKFKLPTRKQVQSFCDTIIFLPIIRAHRINAIGNNLF